jgi:hypothetical protein
MTVENDLTAIRLRLGLEIWRRMCRHLDGIAIGTTVAACADAGVFATLSRPPDDALDIDALAAAHRSPRGYFHLAMRLFEEQGWVERQGAGEGGRKTVRMSDAGRDWLAHVDCYRSAAAAIGMAQDLFTALVTGSGFDGRRLAAIALSEPGEGDLAARVRDHLWGPLAAAAASGLKRSGRLAGRDLDAAGAAAFAVLQAQGWARQDGKAAVLTDAGRLALSWAEQYDHSISYFPTFAAVAEMLFPPTLQPMRAASDLDRHLDRRLDIAFSGTVFSRTCRDGFFALALPLFDAPPLAAQPQAVIDTGAGDGSLLREFYGAIRERTRRGRALAAYPLLMVGVEPSAVAREVMAKSLAAAAVPAVVVDGDIGDPAAIADRLRLLGVDFAAALHVSKSVIHDRRYRPAAMAQIPLSGSSWPPSDAVFVAEDGGLIAHRAMQDDLVRHFRRWLPWIRRHGMIVIEAHTAPAGLIAAHEGSNVMTGLDASHGYSHQYLVERPTYLRAAAEAGLAAAASRALAAEMLGTPIMTIDHWRPASSPERWIEVLA